MDGTGTKSKPSLGSPVLLRSDARRPLCSPQVRENTPQRAVCTNNVITLYASHHCQAKLQTRGKTVYHRTCDIDLKNCLSLDEDLLGRLVFYNSGQLDKSEAGIATECIHDSNSKGNLWQP